MNRRMSLMILLAVLALLGVWRGYLHFVSADSQSQSNQVIGPSPNAHSRPSNDGEIVAPEGVAADEGAEPAYRRFLVNYGLDYTADANKPTGRVGYYDYWGILEHKTDPIFYAWKGVSIELSDMPFSQGSFIRSNPLDLRLIKVFEVAPPMIYFLRLEDGLYSPGYYNTASVPIFFRWNKITIKKNQIPATALEKRLVKKSDPKIITTVTLPKEMLEHPKRWRLD